MAKRYFSSARTKSFYLIVGAIIDRCREIKRIVGTTPTQQTRERAEIENTVSLRVEQEYLAGEMLCEIG